MSETKINHVYLLGLGAIGGTYAAKLFDYFPEKVKIICDTERATRYREKGLTVNGKIYNFDLITPQEIAAPAADLILIAVKHNQLEQAIQHLKGFVGKNTIVISLLNGISNEDQIGREIGMEHMLYAYVYMDAVREGNVVTYNRIGEVVFGERYNEKLSERVLAVKCFFESAGIPYRIPVDMARAMWTKFMLNVGVNQVSAVLRGNYGLFQRSIYATELMILAAREVVALSDIYGIGLNDRDVDYFVNTVKSLNPDSKTSMLQDLEAGRNTEIDIFAGTVIRLGERMKVPTPVNHILYRMIRVAEEHPQTY